MYFSGAIKRSTLPLLPRQTINCKRTIANCLPAISFTTSFSRVDEEWDSCDAGNSNSASHAEFLVPFSTFQFELFLFFFFLFNRDHAQVSTEKTEFSTRAFFMLIDLHRGIGPSDKFVRCFHLHWHFSDPFFSVSLFAKRRHFKAIFRRVEINKRTIPFVHELI